MTLPWSSLLGRLSAGALLFQTVSPAVLPLKQRYDAERDRRAALAAALAKAALPPKPMRGVPLMNLGQAGYAKVAKRTARPPHLTLLDEVGRAPRGIPETKRRERADRVHSGLAAFQERARLQVWLGEYDMAVRHQPAEAASRFALASRLAPPASRERGLARYDLALATFYQGAYREATTRLKAVLDGHDRGYDRRDAAMMARHASACAAFHDERSALGIAEPIKLDPLCGVSAMAVCLRALGLPAGEAVVGRQVRHDGEGSTLQDLKDAADRLGLASHAFTAPDEAFRELPMPLVAHVERDHFIAVLKADSKGVTYVCSDCGNWPGGQQFVDWKQWRALVPDAFLSVSRREDATDLALAELTGDEAARPLYAMVGGGSARNARAAALVARAGRGRLRQYVPVSFSGCNVKPTSGHDCKGSTPVAGDPVNLATGEKEYQPAPDLTVYNPTGPSVVWQRRYDSLSNGRGATNYSTDQGFGLGWSFSYNVGVEELSGGGGGVQPIADKNGGAQTNGVSQPPGGGNGNSVTGNVVLENTARIAFTGALPNATTTRTTMTLPNGNPYLVECWYDAATTKHYFTVTFQDRTRWQCEEKVENGSTSFHRLARQYDRVGNFISFRYDTPGGGREDDGSSTSRLVGIDDSAGQALVTFGFSQPGSQFASVSDRYGRSVYYADDPNAHSIILGDVSQIVPTGASNPPIRFRHAYSEIDNGEGLGLPYLHTLAQPSPTGSGLSTRTFSYTSQGYIDNIVDGNGNRMVFTQGTGNTTGVSVQDPQGNVVQRWTKSFDGNMSDTGTKNAAEQQIATYSYGDGNDPFARSSVVVSMAGGPRTWNYTYDRFGNRLTQVSPKNTSTTSTYDYSQFALGELASVKQGNRTATSYTYYEPSGLVQEVQRPAPGSSGTGSTVATDYSYDAAGNLTQIAAPGNNAAATRSAYFGYTNDGSYTQPECLGKPIRVTDGMGHVSHLRYDARGNLVSVTDALGNTVQASYNLANQRTATSMPPTGQTGSGNAVGSCVYLYTGGPLTQTQVSNESGGLVRTNAFGYGAEGEMVSRSGSGEALTTMYTPFYVPSAVTDGAGHTTTYTYNLLGQLTLVSRPLATGTYHDKTQYTYDQNDRVLSTTDGNGQVENFVYGDADGMLSSVQFPGNTQHNVTLGYDAYDRCVSVSDVTGGSTAVLDDGAHTLSTTRSYVGAPAQSVAYSYWPDGSRKTMVNAAGTWSYGYDMAGKAVSMSSPAGTSGASYLDNGRESSRTLPNGVTTSFTYNAVGMPTSEISQAGQATYTQYNNFSYDASLNLLGLNSTVPQTPAQGGAVAYAYNSNDRITGETSSRNGGYSASFGYDGSGNATTFIGGQRTYNADDQRADAGYSYDGNGNPLSYSGSAVTSDPLNRITSIGSNWSAGYRCDGLRAWKQSSGTKTFYLYDDGEPVLEYNASGTITAVNVYAPDGLVARRSGATWTQYVFDPQGNVAQRLDATGSVASSSIYNAFGLESSTGNPTDPFAHNARWGYYLDRETGLYLCQHRYYDPSAGAWLNRDPIGTRAQINQYSAASLAPVLRADPSGCGAVMVLPMPAIGIGLGGGGAVGGGVVAIGIGGAALGGAAIGSGLDHLTGGGWGQYWCQVLGVDCTGPDFLPPPVLPPRTKCDTWDEIEGAIDELNDSVGEMPLTNPDDDDDQSDRCAQYCNALFPSDDPSNWPSGDFMDCAEKCMAAGGASDFSYNGNPTLGSM